MRVTRERSPFCRRWGSSLLTAPSDVEPEGIPVRTISLRIAGTVTALLVVALSTTRACANILQVPADYGTIQEALDVAADGDTVLVAPGEYVISSPLNFNRFHDPLDVTSPPLKDLELRSEDGADATVIRMSETPDDPGEASVFLFEKGESNRSIVEGFTVTGGRGRVVANSDCFFCFGPQRLGGGFLIRERSSIRIAACRITGGSTRLEPNTFHSGGGLYVENSTLELVNSEVSGHIGDTSAAIFAVNAGVSFDGVRILANHNRQWGAIVTLSNSSVAIHDCLVADNFSSGGGLHVWSGESVTIDRLTVAGNQLFGTPLDLGAPGELKNSIVWGNTFPGEWRLNENMNVHHSCLQNYAGPGGDTIVDTDPLFCGWISDTHHVSTNAPAGGDGSVERPFASLREATQYRYGLSAASPYLTAGDDGGAIGANAGACDDTGTDRTTIVLAPGHYEFPVIPLQQGASLAGGGRENTFIRGTVVGFRPGFEIRELTIEEGPVGGIWAFQPAPSEAIARIEDVDIRRCRGNGGVLAQFVRLEIHRSRVLANTIDSGFGSGIWAVQTSLQITDSLIAANTNSLGGGAVLVGNGATVNAKGVTIAGNWTSAGGGLLINGGRVTLRDSIIWGNSSDEEIVLGNGGGTGLSIDYSCVPEAFVARGEQNIAADPMFCGWPRDEIYVDANGDEGGDGSAERPFRSFDSNLGFSWALTDGSPCRGTGENGVDRGWPAPSCDNPGPAEPSIRVAAGRYRLDASLPGRVRIEGAGAERTTIAGGIAELSEGSSLRDLAVEGTVYIAKAGTATIENCVLKGGSGTALVCRAGSTPIVGKSTITDCATRAILCESASRPLFREVEIRGNAGVALVSQEAEVALVDSSVLANGDGIRLIAGSATLTRCLIARNSGCPISSQRTKLTVTQSTIARNYGTFPCAVTATGETTIRDSIIWGNTESSLLSADAATVSYSCIEGELVTGEGNLNVDPAFCGLGAADEVWVDAAADEGGDGTRENPFAHPNAATEFSFALAEGSPCLGAGTEGGDIGVPFETCASSGTAKRTIRLAEGEYSGSVVLGPGIDLIGAGSEETVIRGALADVDGIVFGLRVDGSSADGILISAGAEAHIERVVVVNAARSGILCGPDSSVVVDNSIVDDNGEAGIACWEGAQIEVDRTTIARSAGFAGRHGLRFGGGFHAAGFVKAKLTRSRFERNDVNGIFAGNGTELSIVACEVTANNLAGVEGHSGMLSLTDSLIAGNHGYNGPALRGANLTVELIGCTVTENRGLGDDGTPPIVVHNSDLTIRNSIVWGNGSRTSVMAEAFPTVTNSLVEGELPEQAQLTDVIDVDPLFRVRGKRDGTDWERGDYRLQPDSPAIDFGSTPVPTSVDLAGRTRVCGPVVDLGAYEYCTSPFRRGDANTDGEGNIADAIFVLGFLFGNGLALDCAAAADTNADDALNIADPIYHLNFLFGDGAPPPPPFEECGETAPEAALDCEIFPACE